MFKHVYFFSCSIGSKSMNAVYNDNDEDKENTPPAADTTSESSLKNEELLEVLKALGSEGFRVVYHEN
jgi:hypothetical protein